MAYVATQGLGMANPAAENCTRLGGRLVPTSSQAGQGADCVLPNGTRCEEWALFRGQCAPGTAAPSTFWLKVALAVGAVGIAWYTVPAFRKLWGKGGAFTPNRRHRKNARWSRKARNRLPDSAYLYVEPGGQARIEGGHKVTIPRSYRHFPYRNAAGNIDPAHLRNAIARIPQSSIPAGLKAPLQAKARALLAEHGGYKRARRAAGGLLRKAA